MNLDMLRLMVQNAQATLQTILMMVDDELKAQTPSSDTTAPAPAPTVDDRVDDESCTHPANERVAAPVMGAPRRFICRMCGEAVKEV
jgi:hypothetical protein